MRSGIEPKEVKVKTVEKTLKLLELLAEQSSPIPLTKLGQMSKLSLSTVHRLLNTLCRSGFVEREKATGYYKLGLKAFLIGNAALQNVELRPTALPFLNQLMEITKESVYLAILSNQDVIYADTVKAIGPMQIGMQTGVPIPACQTSSGKVLLAYLAISEQQSLADAFVAKSLIDNKESFLAVIQNIKEQGFYSEITALGGNVREISAPIFNHLKICIGAASIFIPGYNGQAIDNEHDLIKMLKATANDISKAMGYPRI